MEADEKTQLRPAAHRPHRPVKTDEETQLRPAARRPQEPLPHPETSNPRAPLSKAASQAQTWTTTQPRHPWGSETPGLQAPCLCQLRTPAQPLAPHSLHGAPGGGRAGRSGWVRRGGRWGSTSWGHQVGGIPARGPPGAQGASSLRFAPARTPIRPSGWRQQAGGSTGLGPGWGGRSPRLWQSVSTPPPRPCHRTGPPI